MITRGRAARRACVAAALALAAACGQGGQSQATATARVPTTATSTTTTTESPDTTQGPGTAESPGTAAEDLVAGRYLPLWPFAHLREARQWETEFAPQGHQPWHSDAKFTAVSFAQGYLGFDQIDKVVTAKVDGSEARVTVGYRGEEGGKALPAAVIHLVRYGSTAGSPWEVVGTDDTDLTLTTPSYGSAVRSPVTVGGQITGVDENIQVKVLQPAAQKPLAETDGLPAGGEKHPWKTTVSFRAQEGPATIVAWTGGHLATVERFAVTAVTVTP